MGSGHAPRRNRNLTDRFHDRLADAQDILAALEGAPSRWTPLTKKALKNSTPWRFQATLEWLRKERYVERPERGIYRITERGKVLLRALDDDGWSLMNP